MVQKPIGRDAEPEIAPRATGFPPCQTNPAGGVGPMRGVDRQTPEIVFAQDHAGRRVEGRPVEGGRESPLVPPTERRATARGDPHIEPVLSFRGRSSGVKPGDRFRGGHHPAIRRQERVQGPAQIRRGPARRDGATGTHSDRVDPGIGSARPVNHDAATAQAMKDCLQLPLDGAISTLALPAMETGAVEVQEQVDGASDHARNLAVGAARYKHRSDLQKRRMTPTTTP